MRFFLEQATFLEILWDYSVDPGIQWMREKSTEGERIVDVNKEYHWKGFET